MDRLPEEINDIAPASAVYTLSNSRQNFDLKYQMPKHNVHVKICFFFAQKPSFLLAKTLTVGKGPETQLRARLTVLFQR